MPPRLIIKQIAVFKAYYQANPYKKRAASKAHYRANPNIKRSASKAYYQVNANKKAVCRAHPRTYSHRKKTVVKAWCRAHHEQKRALPCAYFAKNRSVRIQLFRKYYVCHKYDICLTRRARYNLSQPEPGDKEMYFKRLQAN